MRARAAVLITAAALLVAATPAWAQAPTGTISGRIVSADGQPLPGVTVSVMGARLQGTRATTTSANGDYIVPLLPPGDYALSFEIGGFQTVREVRSVAGSQTALVDVTMSLASVNESVTVIGQAQPFVETAQVATNFRQDLMATLPTNRTLDAVLLMAPAVHATGPHGAYTISGSQSYENLFTLNGAVITENLRGQPFALYIEDALQEVTVSTAGVSAEYGRFDGGIANAITKSGGNIFSGSFRTSFANDNWRSLTPYESGLMAATPTLKFKTDRTVPTYEGTLGGPVKKERVWFFTALRSQKQESTSTTKFTDIPYVRTNDEQRYEGKLTYAPRPGHSLQGSFLKVNQLSNNIPTTTVVMDLRSLTNQGQPQNLYSMHYTGVLGRKLFVEAQFSARHLTLTGLGATTTDLINGTLVIDPLHRSRYWSPSFCSGSTCEGNEQRDNSDAIVKGSYFLSGKGVGSHQLVFGYDRFNDHIWANTHVSGSDYRITGTTSILRGSDVFPQFLPGSTFVEYDPLLTKSVGSNLRTHSAFVNDSWRPNGHLSFNLGLRLDKNQGNDGGGQNVGDKASLSPRLSAIWDPTANGKWALSASYSRYVMALTSNVASSTTAAGNPASFVWIYTGSPINPDSTAATDTLVKTDAALHQIFDWFRNGNDTTATAASAYVPGVNVKLQRPLASPYSNEYAGGVSRALGNRGMLRLDGTYREYRNFYSLRTDLSTGKVTDRFNNVYDLNVVENTDVVKRRYASLVTQVTYNVASRLDLGANYTLSHAYGNLEGETVSNGPSGASVLSYPEYRRMSWNAPMGDLMIDQRHRARIWATYVAPVPGPGALTLGLIQQMASGSPYAALATINPKFFVTPNPGYQTPPTKMDYYFTARDEFHTDATYRTDLSVNYGYHISRAGRVQPELFFHGEVLNLFNQFQLCGCGASVFNNGGVTDLTTINQSMAVNAGVPFDPFNSVPVSGVNWNLGPGFGTALSAFAYTSPRIFRFSVGVRF
jgi:hypothetical protein